MSSLHFDYSDLKRILFEAVMIVCFSISIGLAFNYQLLMQAFEGEIVSTRVSGNATSVAALPVPVSLADVQAMPQALPVDARISELYAAGHLPKAVSLPWADVEAQVETFMVNIPFNQSLIVYCSGYGCSDSFDLALLLLGKGYNDVMVYEGGFPEWRDAGLPVNAGQP